MRRGKVFTMIRILLLIVMLAAAPSATAAAGKATGASAPSATKQQTYPRIVLYSVSWCPHCREAKEYFKSHNIPYVNKDVEANETYLKELTEKYKTQAVPVIVIGDREVLRGFAPEKFEKALRGVKQAQ